TDDWLKSKCVGRQEFLILGYIPSTVAAGMVGALLLGYRQNGKLMYAGRVGTGWSTAEARALKERIEKIAAAKPTFAQPLPAGATLTHPDRLLWDEGVSKQALAEFYAEIADSVLPHIAGRVLSVVRAPSGAQAKSFYAKHRWAGLDHVREIDVGEKEAMIAIDDLAGLINLVQGGVVEIHPWGSRGDDLDRPDRLIFDLDPGEDVSWSDVIAAARAM